MDTLSKTDTSAFITPVQRMALIDGWTELSGPTAAMTMAYAILRGKDWRKGFTTITNPTKLENGAFYDWGFWHAAFKVATIAMAADERLLPQTLAFVRRKEQEFLDLFGGLVTIPMLRGALATLPEFPGVNDFAPSAYSWDTGWPIPAYVKPKPAELAVAS